MKNKPMKIVPHNFNRKMLHWLYCSQCGLVRLKNDVTEAAVKKGCTID